MICSAAGPESADSATSSAAILTALELAERLLTRRYGAKVTLIDPEDLGGSPWSIVMRVRVAANPFGLPKSLVVKHYPKDSSDSAVSRFRHEAASCQLFTAMAEQSRSSAALFGYDPATRLLVLEDLGRWATVADKLYGNDASAAERCLLSWSRALGRLHAATAGREHDFAALLRRLGERSWRDPMADEARTAVATLPELLTDKLGVPVSAAAAREARATVRLLGGTRYRAFSPSVTSPDNNLVTSGGVRFVDFEWGCFRDVMLDAAHLRLPFPGGADSFALPRGMPEAMLAAWQAEVISVWPDLDELEVLTARLLDAQLLWVWLCTLRLLPGELTGSGQVNGHGSGPGTGQGNGQRERDSARSSRALLALTHYWTRLAKDAQAAQRPATAELAETVAAALRTRIVEAPAELPLFPAFRQRVAS